jgi:uncharacterized RDD family membrane protein YckC
MRTSRLGESPRVDVPRAAVLRPSGWWRRVAAALIDGMVLWPLLLAIGFAVGPEGHHRFVRYVSVSPLHRNGVLHLATSLALTAIYYSVLMVRTQGRTLGKVATGIRVIRIDGRPWTILWVLYREAALKWALFGFAAEVIPGPGFLLNVDYLFPLVDRNNRAWHDHLAGTRVVRVDDADISGLGRLDRLRR